MPALVGFSSTTEFMQYQPHRCTTRTGTLRFRETPPMCSQGTRAGSFDNLTCDLRPAHQPSSPGVPDSSYEFPIFRLPAHRKDNQLVTNWSREFWRLHSSQSLAGPNLISELSQVFLEMGQVSLEDTDDSNCLATPLPRPVQVVRR